MWPTSAFSLEIVGHCHRDMHHELVAFSLPLEDDCIMIWYYMVLYDMQLLVFRDGKLQAFQNWGYDHIYIYRLDMMYVI